jgi:hypothetical protein
VCIAVVYQKAVFIHVGGSEAEIATTDDLFSDEKALVYPMLGALTSTTAPALI